MRNMLHALIEVRDYIATGWTRGADARDATGTPVGFLCPEAVRWCLRGAIRLAAGPTQGDIGRAIAEAIVGPAYFDDDTTNFINWLVIWNDNKARTQADVLAAIDRAIGRRLIGMN